MVPSWMAASVSSRPEPRLLMTRVSKSCAHRAITPRFARRWRGPVTAARRVVVVIPTDGHEILALALAGRNSCDALWMNVDLLEMELGAANRRAVSIGTGQ